MKYKNIFHYENIDSTQKEAWRLYDKVKLDCFVVTAKKQESGIGTHGRVWLTENDNIAFSYLTKLNVNIKKLDGLTYKVAEIIKNILKSDYGFDIDIKPPNDLMVNGKKLGGILVESKLQKDIVKVLVIGIGINVMSYPKEVNAISLYEAFNTRIDKDILIDKICISIEKELLERMN